MGHSKKKKEQAASIAPELNLNSLGNLMGNVDLSSMASMLNNMNLNQMMSMLSKGSPFNIHSPEAQASVPGDNDGDNDSGNIFSSGIPQYSHTLSAADPTVIVLNSLKPFLPEDKCRIIDDMIKLLGIKSVIDSIFPPRQYGAKNGSLEDKPKN